jgi:hypothetical protein
MGGNYKMNDYTIPAKPTKYKGRVYRSRLEARWAAMFDILKWEYEYEPFDLNGWTPDFLLLGKQPVLVEVKPSLLYFEAQKYLAAMRNMEYELLMVESGPLKQCWTEFGERVSIGHLIDNWEHNGFAVPGRFYDKNNDVQDTIGFCHDSNQYFDRISGINNDGKHIECDNEILKNWTLASNEVMFLRPNL